jgi:hypothetical protein
MSEIKVERGVSIPVDGNYKYPWAGMEVGDSFFIAGEAGNRLRSAAGYSGLRNGRRYSVRKVKGGYRVWRVE